MKNFVKISVSIALPTMVGFAVNYAYQLVDAWWVAQLGPGAPTAIIIAGAVFSLLMSINEIIGISTIPLFTQAFGKKDKEKTGYVIFQGILLKAVLGFIFSFLFLILINNFLYIYTDNAEITAMVKEYGNYIFVSLFLIMPFATIQTALRTIGEANKTMIISIISTFFNLILDPILIFGAGEKATISLDYFSNGSFRLLGEGSQPLLGIISIPSLGIKGAAIATILTQFLGLITAGIFLLKNREKIKVFQFKFLKFDKNLIIKMLTIGIPAGAIAFIFNFEQNFVTSIAANYGVAISDGFGIASRIRGIMFMSTFGLSIGASIAAGQYIGRGEFSQIRKEMKNLILVVVGLLSVLCIPIFIFSPFIMRLFSQNAETVYSGTVFLRFFSIIPYLIAICMMFESVFTAAGKNLPRLFATSLIVLGFEFPIMFISHYYFNLPYWGIGTIMVGTGIIYIITDYILFSTKMWEVRPH